MCANKSFTWKDLKDFCNQLPEEELNNTVKWWGEERGGNVLLADRLDEDFVQTDYGCEPASVQEYEEGQDPYPVVFKKGTPILSID